MITKEQREKDRAICEAAGLGRTVRERFLAYIADAEEMERRIAEAEHLLAEWAPDPESFAASGSHDAATLMRGKIMGAKSVLRILRGKP